MKSWCQAHHTGGLAHACLQRPVLTHAEDVEAEALCDRLADQLIGETVEAHMAAQGKVPLLFILAGRGRWVSKTALRRQVRDTRGTTKPKKETTKQKREGKIPTLAGNWEN